ncbi:hypothetical protein ACFQ1R_05030 [Mariniflexile jejuense]|uniref:Lipoprotein n=1 Tax=Mariniflexile jejuense TaxID=1173582 RepID=A0ABW3JJ85_9FLAO
MKFLVILLSFLFVDNGCSASKINQDAISIEYMARSRRTFKHISINKKNISIVNKSGDTPSTKPCSEADWKNILKVLKPIDVENIPNLNAPSENRFFDGAAIANLKIIYEGKTYESQSFDHGNPPKEIAQLVKEILSISENIE